VTSIDCQEGTHPSKGIRQMPQTSSPASHVQLATACQFLTVTSNTAGLAFDRAMPLALPAPARLACRRGAVLS